MTGPTEPSPGQPPAGSEGFTAPDAQPYGGAPPYGAPPAPYGQGPYPPPYGQQAPSPSDDTAWALVAYLGQLVVGFVAPLVVYLARKDQSPFVRFHGAQALNAALTYMIVVFCGVAAAFAGFLAESPLVAILAILLIFAFGVTHLVYLVIGAVKAGRRESYRLPAWVCWRVIR